MGGDLLVSGGVQAPSDKLHSSYSVMSKQRSGLRMSALQGKIEYHFEFTGTAAEIDAVLFVKKIIVTNEKMWYTISYVLLGEQNKSLSVVTLIGEEHSWKP